MVENEYDPLSEIGDGSETHPLHSRNLNSIRANFLESWLHRQQNEEFVTAEKCGPAHFSRT